MMRSRWLRGVLPLCLCLLLFVTACTPKDTSPYAQVQQETTRRNAPAAIAKQAEQGAEFNKFFPVSTGTYEVIPTQEKKGFAEYKVSQNGKTVAMLSVSDTISLPEAAQKYQSSTFKVGDFPGVDQGTTTTGILVGDRYQVKVLSRDESFSRDDRLAWLQKFDLRGLAALAPATVTEVKPQTAPALPTATQPSPTKAPKPTTVGVPKLPRVRSPQPAA